MKITTSKVFYIFIIFAVVGFFIPAGKASSEHNFTVVQSDAKYSLSDYFRARAERFSPLIEAHKDTFFSRDFLKNPARVREALSTSADERIEQVSFTVDDVPVGATFFNRGSSTLVVIVGGFAVPRESLTSAVKLLEGYDLLFCDFPGHGPDRRPATTIVGRLTDTIGSWVAAGFNRDDMTYADRESKCIDSAIKLVTERKSYTKIVGAGFCYGAYFLVKLHREQRSRGERGFNALWLDGLWHSIASVADHYLYFQFVRLSDSALTSILADSYPARCLSYGLTRAVVGKDLAQFPPVMAFFKDLGECEVVLVKAHRDVLVPDEDFAQITAALKASGVRALIWEAPGYHARVHINHKELYAHCAHAFIDGGVTGLEVELER